MASDYEALKVFETKVFLLKEESTYDGSQLKPLWGYITHGIQGNSIIVFQGPISLHKDDMSDVKDIRREQHLTDFIVTADKAINFVIEHFDQMPNLTLMYHRLILLSSIAKELIYERTGKTIRKDGSSLYFNGKKLSVGVATVNLTSGKMHFSLNVTSEGAPSYLKISSLNDIGIVESDALEFGKDVATRYAMEIMEIASDVSKTRPIL